MKGSAPLLSSLSWLLSTLEIQTGDIKNMTREEMVNSCLYTWRYIYRSHEGDDSKRSHLWLHLARCSSPPWRLPVTFWSPSWGRLHISPSGWRWRHCGAEEERAGWDGESGGGGACLQLFRQVAKLASCWPRWPLLKPWINSRSLSVVKVKHSKINSEAPEQKNIERYHQFYEDKWSVRNQT